MGLRPRQCVCSCLVSTLYSDSIDEGKATKNPARMLPKKTRALFRPTDDPKKTPFLERKKDIARVYQSLPPSFNVAFAIPSALAGLRPGEVRALKWANVDLKHRRIYVRESVNGPTKDKDSREAPIVPGLHELLVAWRAKNPTPHNDLVCPPKFGVMGRAAPGLLRHYLGEHRMTTFIKKACKKAKVPELTFYEAGRHTFASQWVLNGGSIEQLPEILGHSTVLVTELIRAPQTGAVSGSRSGPRRCFVGIPPSAESHSEADGSIPFSSTHVERSSRRSTCRA